MVINDRAIICIGHSGLARMDTSFYAAWLLKLSSAADLLYVLAGLRISGRSLLSCSSRLEGLWAWRWGILLTVLSFVHRNPSAGWSSLFRCWYHHRSRLIYIYCSHKLQAKHPKPVIANTMKRLYCYMSLLLGLMVFLMAWHPRNI